MAALYLVGASGWIVWRLAATSAGAEPILFVILAVVEVWAIGRLAAVAVPWALDRRSTVRGDGAAGSPVRGDGAAGSSARGDGAAGSSARGDGAAGSPVRGDVVIVVGSEPVAQLRIAAWSCRFVTGSDRVIVIDAVGRPAVQEECRRLGLPVVVGEGWDGVGAALDAVAQSTAAPSLVIVPVRCAVLPDLLVATTPLLGGAVNAVSVPTTIVADPGLFGGAGYDLGLDEDAGTSARSPSYGRLLDGPLVVRTLALRHVGSGSGRRPWLATGRRVVAAGGLIAVAPSVLAMERAPASESEALRRRWRAVRADRSEPRSRVPAANRFDRWAFAARSATFLLVPVSVWTGRVPLTMAPSDLAFILVPWWCLTAVARRTLVPRRWGVLGQLRRDVRTLGADLHAGLRRGGEPAVSAFVRYQRTTALALVVLALITSAPLFGVGPGVGPPDLASALSGVAALVMLGVARDTLWASTERQRRGLPREAWAHVQPAGPFRIKDVSPLGILVDGPPTVQVSDVVDVDLALPLPGRPATTVRHRAVVQRVKPGEGIFLQFDLDDDLFDELLYFTAVTLPMMRRLDVRARPVVSIRERGRQAPVPDLAPWMASVLRGATEARTPGDVLTGSLADSPVA